MISLSFSDSVSPEFLVIFLILPYFGFLEIVIFGLYLLSFNCVGFSLTNDEVSLVFSPVRTDIELMTMNGATMTSMSIKAP